MVSWLMADLSDKKEKPFILLLENIRSGTMFEENRRKKYELLHKL